MSELLDYQSGLVSSTQLLRCGITRDALRCRLGRTRQSVHPGVVATFTGSLDAHQHLVAAQLYGGPQAYVSSWTAAAWYGVEAAREVSIIRLTVPAHLSARRSGLVLVTRTTRADPALQQCGPLRISSRARAVVDAACAIRGERRAKAIITEAVQRRIVPLQDLRHELECGARRGRTQVRQGLEAAEAGTWSVPEADLLEILGQSAILPPAWANPALTSDAGERLPTPDAWFDDVGLAVQVHSRADHARDANWETTVSGDSLLGEHGVPVIGVTPTSLTTDPETVRHRVERAYLAAQGATRPKVLAVPLIELRSRP